MSKVVVLLVSMSVLAGVCLGDSYLSGSSASCAPTRPCFSTLCSCISAPVPSNINSTTANVTLDCLSHSTAPCTTRSSCLLNLTECLNKVAEDHNGTTGCTAWALNINMARLSIVAGTNFSATGLYSRCAASATQWGRGNSTTNGTNATGIVPSVTCVFPPRDVCASPVQWVGELRISGNAWATMLANPTAAESVKTALQTDLSNVLGVPATVRSTKAGSIIVIFSVPQALDARLAAALAVAASDTNWLTSTLAVYAANGGTDTPTLLGLGEVGGTPVPLNTPQPPTPNPVSTPLPPTPNPTFSPQFLTESNPACSVGCVIGIVVGAVVLVSIVAIICGCRKRAQMRDKGKEPF